MRSACIAALVSSACLAYALTRPADIPFEKHMLDSGQSESAAVCDIDGDGKLDIVSGENWYQAPRWTKHHFRDILFTNNYIDDLSTLALDVDGDGHPDLVTSGWFSKRLAWWRNPGKVDGKWVETTIETGFPIEFTFLVDLKGDGTADDILPQFGDTKAPLAWYEHTAKGFTKHVASERSYGHGIGVGDVNGDGKPDILTPEGWLEAPSWTFHPDWKLGSTGQIFVTDVNGDGRPDILTSMAHDYGIFWLERTADNQWKRHEVDASWSQAHSMTLVDFRKSGNLGILTGKRFMAHNGRDPGEREPLGIYWYERLLNKQNGEVEWARHVIDYSTRAGGGIQTPAVDIDGDGDVDFVAPGKSGLFLFENKTH